MRIVEGGLEGEKAVLCTCAGTVRTLSWFSPSKFGVQWLALGFIVDNVENCIKSRKKVDFFCKKVDFFKFLMTK